MMKENVPCVAWKLLLCVNFVRHISVKQDYPLREYKNLLNGLISWGKLAAFC